MNTVSTEPQLQEAIAAHQRGDLAAARKIYHDLLQIEPRNATALGNLAVIAISDKDHATAEKYLRDALSIRSDDAGFYSNLGVALRAQGKLDDAVVAYTQALRLRPNYADAYHNLGNALSDQSRVEQAVAAFAKAVELKPDYAEAWNNLGNALLDLGRSDEALAAYDRALALQPDLADAHLNRGILFLRNGQFSEGWPEYEYRFSTWRYASARPASHFPLWAGEPLAGKNLLVLAEQGLGDTIQFVRYLPLLPKQGAKVTFLTPPNLARLLRPFAKVVAMPTALAGDASFDFQTSLVSLPYRLGTQVYTIPRPIPYLFAEPELVARWRERIGAHGLKIGICWQGNPGYRDPARAVPLAKFAALARIPGVRLISLQKHHGLDQLARLPDGMRVETLGDDFDAGADAFIDSAAVMNALDLVMTTDTSIAHLAGALGRPVWLALKHAPHWTWMMNRSDSPWYPSMRLFRQSVRGNWDTVFAAIAQSLRSLPRPAGEGGARSAPGAGAARTISELPEVEVLTDTPPHPRATVPEEPHPAAARSGAAPTLPLQGRDEASRGARSAPSPAEQQLARGIEAHQRGDPGAAESAYREALRLDPGNATALANLAVVEISKQDYAAAEEHLRRALSARTDDAGLYSNLGVVLRARRKLEDAVSAYEQALRLRPDYADAHHNLGNALADLGRHAQAIAAYRKAIELKPDYADAHNNLGNALRGCGRLDEAIAAYRRSIELKPDNADAYGNLAITFKDLGRLEESIASHHHAVALRPANAPFYNNLGASLRAAGRFEEAVVAYRKAVEIKADYAEAYNNLGNALQDQGKLADALLAYARAVELKADYAEPFGQLVHQRQHACDWAQFDADQDRLIAFVRRGDAAIAPFILLASNATPADQLLAARNWAAGVKMKAPESARFTHPRGEPREKLRLGYLSADFHQHATAFLMAELFERHDHSRFELFAYSYGPDDGSGMRARLTKAFDSFTDIRLLPHGDTARRIHDDRVDILIDLKGYTTHARTEVLAYRPAPVQVNYLGFPGTLGADFADVIIADPFIIPERLAEFYAEKIAYLPDCYQPNDTKRVIAEEAPSRAECGLPKKGFVFCCFNNTYKITPSFFDIWMRLLREVKGSVLWLLEANALAKGNLRKEASARGIDPERLVFAPRAPLAEHLARHRHGDLFLDTLPCNAHTTASDALWAGIPVLTCAGETFTSRVAGSLVRASGLPELVVTSVEDYEKLALKLARAPRQLATLRKKLERSRKSAPLFDIARFTKNLEAAYTRMWDEYCERLTSS